MLRSVNGYKPRWIGTNDFKRQRVFNDSNYWTVKRNLLSW